MKWRELLRMNADQALETAQELGSRILPTLIKRNCRPSDVVCKLTDNYSLESIVPSAILSVTDFVVNHPIISAGASVTAGCSLYYLYHHPEARQALQTKAINILPESLANYMRPKPHQM